jgi:hypothetical protein
MYIPGSLENHEWSNESRIIQNQLLRSGTCELMYRFIFSLPLWYEI